MPATLDPIDSDGTAFRVLLNGKRIGTVTANTTLGHTIWRHQAKDDDPPSGVFADKEEAADQLAVNYVSRPKRKP